VRGVHRGAGRAGEARTHDAAGDMNKLGSCAPAGMWERADWGWALTPGVQHANGSASHLRGATSEVLPATYTDHDFLRQGVAGVTGRAVTAAGTAER
jgi:hypothetical protein